MSSPNILKTPALAFHKVDTAFEWGVTTVTPRRFRKFIAWLAQEGYKSVLPDEIGSENSAQSPHKSVLIQFDDAYESVYHQALPILNEFGMKATVHVVTGFVGRENDWDVNLGGLRFKHAGWEQLGHLKEAGWEISSHTCRHPDLTRISDAEMEDELLVSKQQIESKLGVTVKSLAPPFGRYNQSVVDFAAKCGYQRICAFWANRKALENQEIVVIPRKACYLFDTNFTLNAKLGKSAFSSLEQGKLRIINFFSHGTALVKPVRY